jgi:hypothetical protein
MPVFSGIFGAAEEAVLSEVHKNSFKKSFTEKAAEGKKRCFFRREKMKPDCLLGLARQIT